MFRILNSLFFSSRSWADIFMNFIIELSTIIMNQKTYDVILMIICRLSKMHNYILCLTEKDETLIEMILMMLLKYVWKLHDFSTIIMSNWDFHFVSFIREFLRIKTKLSNVFHSKINDQSEIINKKMKRYFKSYYNNQQNDWVKWLLMIEYAFNVIISTSIYH